MFLGALVIINHRKNAKKRAPTIRYRLNGTTEAAARQMFLQKI
jgi:hypothetical protein